MVGSKSFLVIFQQIGRKHEFSCNVLLLLDHLGEDGDGLLKHLCEVVYNDCQ